MRHPRQVFNTDFHGFRSSTYRCQGGRCVPLVLAGLLVATAAQGQTWQALFDGTTLDGWQQRNGQATYRVEAGTIVGTTAEGSPNSFLCTTEEYGDFELEFEVMVAPALNSGVQIRSRTENGAQGRVNGPQVEIEASGESGSEAGYVYGEATGRGWLTPDRRLVPHHHFRDGDWNYYRILAVGSRIQTWINGHPIETLIDDQAHADYPKGFIGLQVHAIPAGDGPYEVRWRALRIRKLDP